MLQARGAGSPPACRTPMPSLAALAGARAVWTPNPPAASGPDAQQRQQDRLARRTQSQNVAGRLGDSHPNRVGGRLVRNLPCTRHSKKAPPGIGRGL